MAHKAYRYRMYPNEKQAVLLDKTIGSARFVYNKMLEDKIRHFEETKETLHNTPAQYKDEYPWLKEVDSLALANSQLNLETAYRNFFRDAKIGFPKFKSKHKSKLSYTTNVVGHNLYIADEKHVRLPKVGMVRCKLHRLPPDTYKLKSATISQERDGKYYISLLYEYGEHIVAKAINNEIGLDYKSDGLYMDSNGHICNNPKWFRKSQDKLAQAQRRLSRKAKGSKNRERAKLEVAKIHKHIANQRKDFLHKESTKIANLYDLVCVEDLNMKAIANSGFGNGKATMDNGYGMFVGYLDYKLRERGKYLIKVDKWYPSSQLCSNCGHQNKGTKELRVKEWVCPICGSIHNRDINAAKNILSEGKRKLEQELAS